jgi:hypothetical protein
MNSKLLLFISLLVLTSCGGSKTPSDPHPNVVKKNLDIFTNGKKLYAANSDSPKVNAMLACALDKSGRNCSPSKLPFIGMENEVITAKSIFDRTLVSHHFMASTFKSFLENLKNENLLHMFSSVAGVVITDEISSSFYTTRTGMIYINANFIWKNLTERSQLKFKEDTRGEPSPNKTIEMYHSYYKNGVKYNSGLFSRNRTQKEISNLLTRVLYHELAHTMDYFPPKKNNEIRNSNETYLDIAEEKFKNSRLSSDSLGYAEGDAVYFYAIYYFYNDVVEGKIPQMNSSSFMSEFNHNNGITLYSYSTKREHLAMLIEAYMMTHIDGYQECNRGYEKKENKWTNFWSQKNRVLQDSVNNEAKKAISLIFNNDRSHQLTSISTGKTQEESLDGNLPSDKCF